VDVQHHDKRRWDYKTLSAGGTPAPFLVDPGNYPDGRYNDNTDDRAYKSFNLSGVDVAMLQAGFAIDVASGDHFRIGYSGGGGDPFEGGIITSSFTGISTYPILLGLSWDVSGCIGASCSIGFQLQSDSSVTEQGVAIAGFGIGTLTLNATTYRVANGTSMASPEAAGLATMLRVYNPQYTYADVVNAIKQGGRPGWRNSAGGTLPSRRFSRTSCTGSTGGRETRNNRRRCCRDLQGACPKAGPFR
jgi:subtilisin family serine protease